MDGYIYIVHNLLVECLAIVRDFPRDHKIHLIKIYIHVGTHSFTSSLYILRDFPRDRPLYKHIHVCIYMYMYM